MVHITLILDNVRSAHNVGSILRTADATGVEQVICCGITPYPRLKNDERDPLVSGRNQRSIAKTALGAELSVSVEHLDDTVLAIEKCREAGAVIIGLEQTTESESLLTMTRPERLALVVGNEVDGIGAKVLSKCDILAELPQRGQKESLNVSVATAVALYALAFR